MRVASFYVPFLENGKPVDDPDAYYEFDLFAVHDGMYEIENVNGLEKGHFDTWPSREQVERKVWELMGDKKPATMKPASDGSAQGGELVLVEDAHVAMVTFGGQQFYDMPKGETFHYGFVEHQNPVYTVFRNGCNHYVFPTASLPKTT